MLSGAVLMQFRTYLKILVDHSWSVEGRKSKGRPHIEKQQFYKSEDFYSNCRNSYSTFYSLIIEISTINAPRDLQALA